MSLERRYGKVGYYYIPKGIKFRIGSYGYGYSDPLPYDVRVYNDSDLWIIGCEDPVFLGQNIDDIFVNQSEQLDLLRSIDNYNKSKHDEFVIFDHKFTLLADGVDPVIYNEVEEELLYNGGLKIDSILPFVSHSENVNGSSVLYGEDCGNELKFTILSVENNRNKFGVATLNDRLSNSSGSLHSAVFAEYKVSGCGLVPFTVLIKVEKRIK